MSLVRKSLHFDQADPRPPLFTIISQHSFLTSFSSIFPLTVKVREPTCLTKRSKMTINLVYFCPIIAVS